MPIRKPKSPTRFVMKALIAAAPGDGRPAEGLGAIASHEADQEIGRQAHQLPAYVDEQEVRRQNEDQH